MLLICNFILSCIKPSSMTLQSNLAILTSGFHVTLLITSVFQSTDFLYMILM